MIDALGTSTPTSITEVATMICAVPLLKRFMPYSLSAGFILPCTTTVTYSGGGKACVMPA